VVAAVVAVVAAAVVVVVVVAVVVEEWVRRRWPGTVLIGQLHFDQNTYVTTIRTK
jgi:hypothetical protein